jgi:phospholipase A2
MFIKKYLKFRYILLIGLCVNIAFAETQPIATAGRSYTSSQESDIIAYVRQGNDLCTQEQSAAQARSHKVLVALKNLTGKDIDINHMPTIGLACSGGGCKAAIATLGFLRGLQKIGVLDATMYLATLSGSTWSTTAWLTHGMPLDQLTQFLKGKLETALSPGLINKNAILNALLEKFKGPRDFSFNDIWGAIIADMYLRTDTDSGQDFHLSNLESKVSDGSYPLPLFTSVIGETNPYYEWMEYSPFEIGSPFLKTWVRPWAFGKEFNKGLSSDISREERLGFMLGLFGSAYAGSVGDLIQLLNESFSDSFEVTSPSNYFTWLPWNDNFRISAPEVYNFSRNLKDTPLADQHYLSLIDGGFAFNLPIPPLLRRNTSVQIICDVSSDSCTEQGNDLRKVEFYASQHGFALPTIDYKTLVKQKISIVTNSDNPTLPIIIYVQNTLPFSMFKFRYTPQEFDSLMGSMEETITTNADIIKQAIELAIANKQKA